MSGPPKKKTTPSRAEKTDLFTIRPPAGKSNQVPGVTDLLSREELAKKRIEIKNLEPTRNTSTMGAPANAPAPNKSPTKAPSRGSPQAPTAAPKVEERTNLVIPSPLSLKKIGVLFELKFIAEGSTFRFALAQGHLETKLVGWQEAHFQSMKLDPRIVPMHDAFQEFNASKDPFVFDAFAVSPLHWIQVIVPAFSNSRVILVSEHSLKEHEAELIEHFSKG